MTITTPSMSGYHVLDDIIFSPPAHRLDRLRGCQNATIFDETCSKSNQAMTMSAQELRGLLAKCDELQKVIETQETSVRKVYLKRLSLYRNLYAYMLEYKQNNQAK